MSNTIKMQYGTLTTVTVTLASLADGSARESTKSINSSDLFIDAMIYVAIKLGAGSPSGDKQINVYFYGSIDGTNYTDNATGSDAAVTLRTPTNFFGPFIISAPDSGALTYKVVIPSVASFFGGILPYCWGLVIDNQTGLTLDSTGTNHSVKYIGIYEQVV